LADLSEEEKEALAEEADNTNSSTSKDKASENGSEIVPDYLYLINNPDEALDRLKVLSSILNSNSLHADIDKFTGEFINITEVSESIQSIFDELITDFPKLG
jgi:hypothetical protein